MAPTDQKMKNKTFKGKEGSTRKSNNNPQKRKWVPPHKVFEGSIKEGQGFAFKRKQKVKHDYNKLLRTERKKKNPAPVMLYKEDYPEHLRHLYMAEAEKLKKEDWQNRLNRSKLRMKGQQKEMAESDSDAEQQTETTAANDDDGGVVGEVELTDSVSGNTESTERESLPISNRMRKKMQKKTSYQKTKEEFEQVKEKRRKKKEEYLKNKQQREEAIQKYKQKKMEAFQMLSKKTKKGQPNLNLQMEYLLQKIQKN
ncbi:thyroid transcription factor 1-associated protein 26 homolog [Parambassis ranga]|uniref:Thyroid transcription factor 1-associated protein 26 homolog n=1 Tax=Parambassis ranga TaxID=210632 RepID=A0A6P7I6C7_9TELE|nr:thyroid transcription factor 1-associated protein 26 [Parambassis ranga]